MLLAGDEFGRSQRGNNNAYCQDNPISWVNWQLDAEERALLEFTRTLIRLRAEHPVFHRRAFFQGRSIHGLQISDIAWYRPDGQEMTDGEWNSGYTRSLGMLLNGGIMDEWDRRGRHLHDDVFLLLLNAHHEPIPFAVPGLESDPPWHVVLDTAMQDGTTEAVYHGGQTYSLQERSLVLLQQHINWHAQDPA